MNSLNNGKLARFALGISAACLIVLESGCATDPRVAEYRQAARGASPQPVQNAGPGRNQWIRSDGTALGYPISAPSLTRYLLHDFPIDLVFVTYETSEGYVVGTVPRGSGYYIAQLKPFLSLELYGPNLTSIRMQRSTEEKIFKGGGDVLYITKEGNFKASALGD